MSNTSTVTPYRAPVSAEIAESIAAGTIAVAGAAVMATGAAAVAAARWLAEETPEDRAALQAHREARRRELSASTDSYPALRQAPIRIASAGLHLASPETLVRAAERVGYRVLASSKERLERGHPIRLERTGGERLVVYQEQTGHVSLRTAGNSRRLETIVRQHTLDRVVDHLQEKGMTVQSAALPSGDTQIIAREHHSPRNDGRAQVKAQVRTDGMLDLDIECVTGSRCEVLVNELAEAVGGRVTQQNKKPAFYKLPGEPTRVDRRF